MSDKKQTWIAHQPQGAAGYWYILDDATEPEAAPNYGTIVIYNNQAHRDLVLGALNGVDWTAELIGLKEENARLRAIVSGVQNAIAGGRP